MIFVYADPPYPGMGRHYNGREVYHPALIAHLCGYETWALSTASSTLQYVLSLCPDDVRISAWVKPFARFKPNVNPAYAWEPVIWSGGRRRARSEPTVRDWHSEPITLQRGVAGAKPDGFWFWLFRLVNCRPGDEFIDLFPGSGGGERAWKRYSAQRAFL